MGVLTFSSHRTAIILLYTKDKSEEKREKKNKKNKENEDEKLRRRKMKRRKRAKIKSHPRLLDAVDYSVDSSTTKTNFPLYFRRICFEKEKKKKRKRSIKNPKKFFGQHYSRLFFRTCINLILNYSIRLKIFSDNFLEKKKHHNIIKFWVIYNGHLSV